MAEVGIAFGALGAINLLAQRLSGLKNRIKDFGSLPGDWDSSIKSFKNCQECVERIHLKLVTDQGRIGERTTDEFRSILNKVEESLTKAEPIVKRLENEYTREGSSATTSGDAHGAGSSSEQCRRLFQSKNRCVDGRQVKEVKLLLRSGKLKTELESFGAIWRDAQHTIDCVRIGLEVITAIHDMSSDRSNEAQSAIERVQSTIATIRESHEMSSDKYRRHFDEPLVPNEVVLDFSGDTMEAELKRAVLSNSSCGRVTAAFSSALVGAVGMGGVGKTVALQRLCWESDVQKKYSHGVFFSSLGQNVTEKRVIECVAHFVESSGGECLAKEIITKTSADSAAKQASLWFKGLCALFVCDDIWSLAERPIGYLDSLKLLLSNSRSSAMVISTRERSVAQQLVKVNFIPREFRGEQAWSILAKYARLESEDIRGSSATSAALRDILDVCCGLPVALGAAGTSLRNSIQEGNGMIGQCVVEYARELKENIESVGDENVDGYRGLRAVIDNSLLHCEAWAKGAEGVQKLGCKLNVRDKFEALSVLRKQGWIPRTCLKRLWGTSERATKQLMSKLSDMHLVLRRRQSTPVGEIDGLILHDLVLEQAEKLSVQNNRAEHWHAQMLNGYLRKAAGSVAATQNHDCREWWDFEKVPEDGYIEKNVARHLKMSGGCELELLLSDIRWSMRRMEVGGLVALRDDFHELSIESERAVGVEAVRRAIEEDWSSISKSRHSIPFAMNGRLQAKRTSSEFVERFLSSVSMQVPKPHFVPKQELSWRAEARQLFRIDFEDRVASLCLSKDNNIIAVAQGCEVKVFDLQAMCTVCTLKGHEKVITSIDISTDGNRIVSGSSDRSVRVWDGNAGECLLDPLRGHEDFVSCIAISSDGSRIASGSWDRSVRVWDGNTGECLLDPLRGHEDFVSCIAISSDGSRIVSGSWDTSVRVWDGNTGECLLEPLRGHKAGVSCIAISGDGSRIVSGSDDTSVLLWDGNTGECLLDPLRGHESFVSCIAISGDGSRIVSGFDDTSIRVWDGNTGECLLDPLRGHETGVSCIAISGDGSRIVSGSDDKSVRVWDGNAGECLLDPLGEHKDFVSCIAISSDGSRIVSGSWDRSVRVWDGNTGECLLDPLRGHKDLVSCIAISSDGSRIMSGSWDRSVRVWDGNTGEYLLEPLRGHKAGVSCIAISGDGSRIVSGFDDKSVRVWDGNTGECALVPRPGSGCRVTGSVRSLEFDEGSSVCLVRTTNEVFLLDTDMGNMAEFPDYMFERNQKIFAMTKNAKAVQVATLPSVCATFRYNKLTSRAAVGLFDGQVVVGELEK